jgi:hypothetical protein
MNGAFAASGIAEALMDTVDPLPPPIGLMLPAFNVAGVLTLVAFGLRSRKLAVFGTVVLLLATLLFQPWKCFWLFEVAYPEMGILSAGVICRFVGFVWLAVCVAVVGSLLFTFLTPMKGSSEAATYPTKSEGLPGPERGVRSAAIQIAPELSGVTLREGVFRATPKTDDH